MATAKTTKPAGGSKTKTNIRPLGDRVLVQRVEAEERTAGGILLPESAKEKPREGRVIAIGEGKLLDNGQRSTFSVSPGDRVLFSSYAGTDVKLLGDEYLIMREEDILGIIQD
jgi:chaperonin GroES